MLIPIITGIILVFLRPFIHAQRVLSLLAIFATGALSIYMLGVIQNDGILTLAFGNWPAPYGVVFVADSFAMLLVATSSFVTFVCLLYAFATIGEQYEKMFFYPFVLFLIAGVHGSFLTGDLFNLFVCFEVMLLASYVLITLGGKKVQLRESFTYLAINVLSSWIFLVAIAYLYGTLGTVNMAHLSELVAKGGQTPILTTISILFLIVFALKAGLFLYFWLPGSYRVPPTAIRALFGALLTKVGIYAMFRMFTLIFYHEPSITHTAIGIMAGLTLIGGSIGAIAYQDVHKVVAYNVIIAVGFILVGLAIANPLGIEGAIYYLMHDMVVKALLFLLIGTTVALTGKNKINEMSGLIRNYPMLGWLFFVTMLSLAGIPPLSGFIGKILVGQGAVNAGAYVLLGLAFLSSIFVLYSLLRIFMNSFWGETIITIESEKPLRRSWLLPSIILTCATIALGLGADVLADYVHDASHTLLHPSVYIDAVMNQ